MSFLKRLQLRLRPDSKISRYLAYAIGEILLIVIGVFLAVQLNNLNENRIKIGVEENYLNRLSQEVQNHTDHFHRRQQVSIEARASVDQFFSVLHNDTSSPEMIVSATRSYFDKGAYWPQYRPVTTTFDDLESTGNLGVIRNPEVRQRIIEYYGTINSQKETRDSNVDWVLGSDSKLIQETDALRWDSRTSGALLNLNAKEEADLVRSTQAILTRNALAHLWLIDRTEQQYRESTEEANRVLAIINGELSGRFR